jgi:regulator of sirC expression with transglutaminase-like and TPR domain
MRMVETSNSPACLPERQRMALISLLADDDPAIYHVVRAKLLSYGSAASYWLKPHTLSNDPRMRRRAVEIIQRVASQRADQRFLEFCQRGGEDLDLEEATGLLAQTKYPDASLEAYRALYDQWADSIRPRLDGLKEAERILRVMNSFVFGELGFSGHEQYAYDPECSYLNRIADRRRGNPIGLCTVYLLIARRLRLPITGIGLPGYFICRFQSSTKEIYIDCFRKGEFMTKADCVKHLLRTNFGIPDGHLSPLSARRIVQRMCNNLHVTYAHLEVAEEAARVQRYVMALSR